MSRPLVEHAFVGWCPYCRQTLTQLGAMARRMPNVDFAIIVQTDGSRNAPSEAFVESVRSSGTYGLAGLPNVTVVADGQGTFLRNGGALGGGLKFTMVYGACNRVTAVNPMESSTIETYLNQAAGSNGI